MSVQRKRQSKALRTMYIKNNPLPYFKDWFWKKYPPKLYHPHYGKFFLKVKMEYIQLALQREIKEDNRIARNHAKRHGHEYKASIEEIVYGVSRLKPF